ncbi:DUF3883 domain-containing protein [Synechococcus sp. CS-1324]|nr:DUF3883 domain-containing protein [Synechococcus sp. CS-1324]
MADISFMIESFEKKAIELQQEAIRNTQIIEELAGLEKYIAETYVSRVFYEIIQNADDCGSTRFHAFSYKDAVILFNNGTPFSDTDLESLCRSAFSAKQRGSNIGYRGIGFKSVAGVCTSVSLLSGELGVYFSRQKTQEVLSQHSRVPLLRVPHLGSLNEDATSFAKAYMVANHMKTCFILHEASTDSLLIDLKGLNRTSIAFLRNLKEIDISINNYSKKVMAELIQGTERKIGAINQKDLIIKTDVNVDDKASTAEHRVRIWNFKKIGVSTDVIDDKPVRLKKNDAYAQAFLPMLTTTGLGARINGDFSTDPSRSRINPDKYTRDTLKDLIELIFMLLDRLCDENLQDIEKELLETLIPYKNAAMFDISPSYISDQIQAKISDGDRIILAGFLLCPSWLKKTDYKKLAKAGRYKPLSFDQVAVGDYESFFFSLGATKLGMLKALELLAKTKLTSAGIVSFWRHILDDIRALGQIQAIDSDLCHNANLFICSDGTVRSGNEISQLKDADVDIIFMASLFDLAGRSTDAADLCVHFGLPVGKVPVTLLETIQSSLRKSNSSIHHKMLMLIDKKSQTETAIAKDPLKSRSQESTIKLKASDTELLTPQHRREPSWRSIEKVASKILTIMGYIVDDVSKKNVGYDYIAYDDDGNQHCIEVKKLEALGEDFLLTDNEIYVSKDIGENYWILLIVQPSPESTPTHYAIIKNFYRTFESRMTRRCIKYQMFCSEYDADFERLVFE